MLQAKQQYEDTKDAKYLKEVSRYNNIQMARKISLNSAYGAIGNEWFRYYDLRIAEGITTSGQFSIRWIEKSLNVYLNKLLKTEGIDYVIASDTDSVYITFDKLVNTVLKKRTDESEDSYRSRAVDFLDRVAQEKIEPFIDKSYQALASYVGAYEQKMQMAREVIADKGIWTAKKRYILNAYTFGVYKKYAKLKEGDYVCITNCGAYGRTLSSNYNMRPFIEEIVVNNNKYKTVRKRQKIENLI